MIDRLIDLTEGDLRRSINTLQTCASFAKNTGLKVKDIEAISGVVPTGAILMIDSTLSTRGVAYSEI